MRSGDGHGLWAVTMTGAEASAAVGVRARAETLFLKPPRLSDTRPLLQQVTRDYGLFRRNSGPIWSINGGRASPPVSCEAYTKSAANDGCQNRLHYCYPHTDGQIIDPRMSEPPLHRLRHEAPPA